MKIHIVTLSKKWSGINVRKNLIERALHAFEGDIALALSTDSHVQQLNNNFRAKDKPTNVLSFPNHAHNGGDIILSIETLKREAKAEDKPLRDHLEHLIVHGILHCFGYDHEDDKDWDAMVKIEMKICKDLGFSPYTYDFDP